MDTAVRPLNTLRALAIGILALTMFSTNVLATLERPFTILHTNDWQSRLLGFGPNTEYTPNTINDDGTVGGVARLATRIDELRGKHQNKPTLLLDGGDISQGTLFHTLYRQQAFELRLMKKLGYDAITLGNHEFDFGSNGLSAMLSAAEQHLDELPPILASNLKLAPAQKHWQENGVIKSWKVIEKDGIRFGLFGIMGADADLVTPTARPSTFADQIETSAKMVKLLREEQQADVVIMLSHSGVVQNDDGSWGGEEVEYAKQLEGVDVIVGGHSHTALHKPIVVNDTIIVQAGSEIQYLGELNLALDKDNKVRMADYTLHPINDQTLGDQRITGHVEQYKQLIDDDVLAPKGYRFDQAVVRTPATLTRDEPALGNLISDGIRQAAQSDIAMTAKGVIRDDMIKGESGYQSVSDIFRLQPLGVGVTDDEPGYPLIKLWLTGREVRDIMEVLSMIKRVKGDDYVPSLSGIRFTFNDLRIPLDRITTIEVGDAQNGFTPLNEKDPNMLYSIATSSYVGSFLWLLGEMSFGLLDVVPKDEQGQPLANLDLAIIDRDPNTPGIQEYKNWQAQLDFFASLPDTDGDDIANITLDESVTAPRIQRISSLNPINLLQNATWIGWTVFSILLILGGALLSIAVTRVNVWRNR